MGRLDTRVTPSSDQTQSGDDPQDSPPQGRSTQGGRKRPRASGKQMLGDMLRGLARAATVAAGAGSEETKRLAEAAKPEVERRAKQLRVAAETAAPHLRQAAEDAVDYVRDHQQELRRGAKRGAGIVAEQAVRTVTPAPLRPAIQAMKDELQTPDQSAADASRDGESGQARQDPQDP